MKKIAALLLLSLSLAGCIVVPEGRPVYPAYHYGYYQEGGCHHCWR